MVKDFDAFFNEVEKKPITFKIFGEIEELPPALPATIVLKLYRSMKEYGDKIPEHVQFDMAFSIFGEDRVEKWCNKGLTVDQLAEVMKYAMSQYGTAKIETKTKKGGSAVAKKVARS